MIARLPYRRPDPLRVGVGGWKLGVVWWALCLLALTISCARPDPRPHHSLDPTLEALRAQFNADAQHTRILMIVAPT